MTDDDPIYRAHAVCKRFEAAWRAGLRPPLRPYVEEVPPEERAALVEDLLALDLELRAEAGERPDETEYRRDLPEFGVEVEAAFLSAGLAPGGAPDATLVQKRPPAPPPVRPAAPPRTVGGYEVGEELGRGGMGVVYKAWQPRLKRHVALKVIRAGDYAGSEELVRFRSEAEAAARLSHPNIVQVYEVGEHEGLPFLSLEYISGGTLAQRLGGDPQPLRAAAELIGGLARAVHAAHLKGVIHRDLKPANVLLQVGERAARPAPPGGVQSSIGGLRSATPKITDFGLAKIVGERHGATQTGSVLGTPSYMAPEQVVGGRGAVGPAVDVYALGAILYEMITGRPPFKAEGPTETMMQVLHEEVVAPSRLRPGLPRDLETICLKCLHKDPARRYASAEALADDLGRWLAGEPVKARPVGPAERAAKWVRRNPALTALGATTAALVVVAFGLVLVSRAQALGSAATERSNAATQTGLRKELQQTLDENTGLTADLAIDQGTALCRNGDTDRGLMSFFRGMSLAREAGNADLERVARHNLAAWAETHIRLRATMRTKGWCNCAVFSPDEQEVLTGGSDGIVQRWRVADGEPVGDPIWHEHPVWSVAYGPRGTVVTGSGPNGARWGSLQVWDTRTRECLKTVAFPARVSHVLFNPKDGRTLLAVCIGYAQLFSSDTFEPTGRVMTLSLPAGGKRGILAAAFSPDGEQIVTAGLTVEAGQDEDQGAGSARLWTADGQLRYELTGHRYRIRAVAFSPDGSLVATGSVDRSSRVWSTATGERVGFVHDHPGTVESVAFSPDGKTLATGCSAVVRDTGELRVRSGGGQARLWDAASGIPLTVPLAHPRSVHVVTFSPKGRWLLTGCEDSHTRLFAAATGEPFGSRMVGSGNVRSACFGHKGRLVLTASNGNSARLWGMPPERKPEPPLRVNGRVMSLDYSANGDKLLSATSLSPVNRGVIGIWGPAGEEPVQEYDADHRLWSAAFHPDGGVVSVGPGGFVRRWGSAAVGPVGGEDVHVAAFAPDRRRVFGAGPARAGVWRTDGGVPSWPESLGGRLDSPVWDPDGKGVFVTTEDGRVERRGIDGGVTPYDALKGSRVAAACPKRRALLTVSAVPWLYRRWTFDGRPLPGGPLSHEGNELFGAAFSADGQTVATCGLDGTVRRWDVATGKPLGPPVMLPTNPFNVTFRPDGRQLAVGRHAAIDRIDVPAPAAGEPDAVRAWVEKLTGLKADEG